MDKYLKKWESSLSSASQKRMRKNSDEQDDDKVLKEIHSQDDDLHNEWLLDMSMGNIDVGEDSVEADISGSELLRMAVAHKSDDDSRNDTLKPGPLDISSSPEQGPHQPKGITFAKNSQGRRFNPDWYNKHPWLEYSVGKRQAFYFPCRHLAGSSTSGVSSGVFLSEREDRCGKCTGLNKKDNRLLKHEHSQGHEVSVDLYNSWRQTEKSGKTVMDFLDEGHRKAVKTNRDYIKIIADVLRLTAVQNMAQRGERENEDSGNKGNFLEIIDFLKPYCQLLRERLDSGPSNAKYTYHSIQDAIIGILSDMIMEKIRTEVGEAQFVFILADETKDLSKKEQLSCVLRYIYDGDVHEEFIGFTVAESLNAESLSKYILDELSSMGIDPLNVVGQGYDGASVMSGCNAGVQQKVRETALYALYVHCFNHRLNLTIVDTVKADVPVADFFSSQKMIYNFACGSAVHTKWIKFQEKRGETVGEFKALCDTRWAAQVRAVAAEKKRFVTFVPSGRNCQ